MDSKNWFKVIRQRIVRFVEDVVNDGRFVAPCFRKLPPDDDGIKIWKRGHIVRPARDRASRRPRVQPVQVDYRVSTSFGRHFDDSLKFIPIWFRVVPRSLD